MGQASTRSSSLEQFLNLPEFKPALEFLEGRVIQKMSPLFPHSVIQGELVTVLNAFARPRRLGRACPELRAVFGGAAQVPDVSFYSADHLPRFRRGQPAPLFTTPPDLTIEILSPGQTVGELRRKIRHSLKHGSRLGWLIEPIGERVGVLRPGQKIETLKVGDQLTGEPVLPDFAIAIDTIFGWLEEV